MIEKLFRFQANPADLLQYCNAKAISSQDCRKSNPLLSHIIRSWLICSPSPINQVNICSGGLGAALATQDNTLYGILSRNEETSSNPSINIYTNVFTQMTWIRFIITGWPW